MCMKVLKLQCAQPGRVLVNVQGQHVQINLTVDVLHRLWIPDRWGNDEICSLGLDILRPLPSVYLQRSSYFRSSLVGIGISLFSL